MNIERMQTIIDRIKANPACWNQNIYHNECNTAHCLAGHAQIDSGKLPIKIDAMEDARTWLKLSSTEANYLFGSQRTLADFEDFLKIEREKSK